jgi:hypothetical protein
MGQCQCLLPRDLSILPDNFVRQINKRLIKHGIPYT